MSLPSLVIPAEAAITPALFPLLRMLSASRSCRIVWHPVHPPLRWMAAAGPDGAAPEQGGGDPHAGGGSPPAVDDTFELDAPVVLDISTAAARHDAAWRLLNSSGKPQDGWLSRHVHRRVSRVFSYVFMRIGLSANAATLFACVIGLLAAYMMTGTSHTSMIAGGFLFWFASIADGIDGEIARLTLSESRFGEQLDTGVDQLTHLAGLLGVLIGWSRQGIGPAGGALAVGVAVGTPALLLWAMALVRRARRTDQFFVPTKPIEIAIRRAAQDHGTMALRATAAVFLLFRREAFSFAFFLLSLFTAQRAAIPAAIAAGLAVVLLTFLTAGGTLSRALQETVDPPSADTTTGPGTSGSAARA